MKSKYVTHLLVDGQLVTTPGRRYPDDKYYKWGGRKGKRYPHHMIFDHSTTPPTLVSHHGGGFVVKAHPEIAPDFMIYEGIIRQQVESGKYRKLEGFAHETTI
jgi:hypothetical protein